jgi:hypothetical protein
MGRWWLVLGGAAMSRLAFAHACTLQNKTEPPDKMPGGFAE